MILFFFFFFYKASFEITFLLISTDASITLTLCSATIMVHGPSADEQLLQTDVQCTSSAPLGEQHAERC